MDARYVIAAALSLRNEELNGEASPMDNDGARLVIRELEAHGFTITKTGDGAADAAQTMGGSLPLAVPSSPTREQLVDDAARALCLDPHNGTACDMHRVDGALVVDALVAAGHLVDGNGEGSGPEQIGGQSGAASPFVPHRFRLHRHRDPSGVSGTGDVAEGVEFSDGAVAVRWLGEHPSTAAWGGTDDVLHIHGHNGQTEIRWIDDRPIDLWPAEGGDDAD
ncbi:MAG TPA: hypothetical protein VIP77_12055 [Jiangellaceae bacterium]